VTVAVIPPVVAAHVDPRVVVVVGTKHTVGTPVVEAVPKPVPMMVKSSPAVVPYAWGFTLVTAAAAPAADATLTVFVLAAGRVVSELAWSVK
jgi:hypothetical protein